MPPSEEVSCFGVGSGPHVVDGLDFTPKALLDSRIHGSTRRPDLSGESYHATAFAHPTKRPVLFSQWGIQHQGLGSASPDARGDRRASSPAGDPTSTAGGGAVRPRPAGLATARPTPAVVSGVSTDAESAATAPLADVVNVPGSTKRTTTGATWRRWSATTFAHPFRRRRAPLLIATVTAYKRARGRYGGGRSRSRLERLYAPPGGTL